MGDSERATPDNIDPNDLPTQASSDAKGHQRKEKSGLIEATCVARGSDSCVSTGEPLRAPASKTGHRSSGISDGRAPNQMPLEATGWACDRVASRPGPEATSQSVTIRCCVFVYGH
jgi:hypothetical protein